MERVTDIAPPGRWPASAERDHIRLGYDDRHRRRLVLRGEAGTEVLLDLPQARLLRDGDGLRLEGGGYLRVEALAEPLLEIRARSPGALIRLAWHLGNRHLAAELGPDRICIRRDHVIEEMVVRLGGLVRHVEAPFNPETGAYQSHEPHHHGDHGHHHDHHHREGGH
ncbi:MAG TPA: urease accessory protein UreE [Stellaceae bacterium]|nr:urease accessory protein UreE [Stellaceae bacterium]